jgi:hypothetical protein
MRDALNVTRYGWRPYRSTARGYQMPRLQLPEWALRAGAWNAEDDYDSGYR